MSETQYTGVALNTQLLALKFAAAVNYYSDAEESDAGHQFCASGTATDYTEKTLGVKKGRGCSPTRTSIRKIIPPAVTSSTTRPATV